MIKAFTIATARTINLGNYESMRIESSVTFETDDQLFAQHKAAAQTELRKLLEETYKAQRTEKGARG